MIKQGTLGSIQATPEAVETVATTTTEEQQTVATEASTTSVNESGQIQTTTAQSEETTAETVQEDNVASVFSFDEPNATQTTAQTTEQAAATTQQTQVFDWKEAIKTVDKKEIFAALDIPELDDFVLEFQQHRLNGGSAMDYLAAKAIDYNQVSDIDLLRDDFDKKYSFLTPQERQHLFTKKYVAGEFDDEDAQTEKAISLKADAYEARQRKIAEQSKFKITELAQPQQQGMTQEQQAQIEQEQLKAQQDYQRFMEHEATKNLMTSKRVAVNIGENMDFNFPIDKPEALMKVILDADTWQKHTTNEKGEPDVRKLQRLAMAAINPNYEKDLVNYGRSLERKAMITADQNAQRPKGISPMPSAVDTSPKVVRNGSIGSLR